MPTLRIIGVALAVLGALMAALPDLLPALSGRLAPDAGTYALIERRVRGGMVLGLGLVLWARPALKPWSTLVPTAAAYFVAGALAVRMAGIVLDGPEPRQWAWVAAEALVVGLAGLWLWRAGLTA